MTLISNPTSTRLFEAPELPEDLSRVYIRCCHIKGNSELIPDVPSDLGYDNGIIVLFQYRGEKMWRVGIDQTRFQRVVVKEVPVPRWLVYRGSKHPTRAFKVELF